MSDPRPDSDPDTTEPDGTPVENPSGALLGAADAPGDPGDPLEINPDLPLVDPTGGEGA